MRFRLAPNSSPLNALERQKRPLAEIKSFYGAHYKKFNEDRLMLSAAKCRPMDFAARNIKLWGCSWGRLKDRPSKDISDETAGISLFFASLHMTSHRQRSAHAAPKTGLCASQSATPTVLENKAAKLFSSQM